MSNLDLWNKISTTDPAYTKAFSQGFSGTSINSTYLVMKATEQWGLIGFGWGYEIIEERVDTGEPIHDVNGEILGHLQTHTIKLSLWVKQGDEIGRVEHFGHTPYIYYSKKNSRFITDQEAPKKSLTDALKKCLSMYGFSADIFLGLYDDRNYVEDVRAQSAIEKADNREDAIIKQRQEYDVLLSKNLELLSTATNKNELECIYKSISRRAKRENDTAGLKAILDTTNKRKDELEKNNDTTV